MSPAALSETKPIPARARMHPFGTGKIVDPEPGFGRIMTTMRASTILALQLAVAAAALVPISAGFMGVVWGAEFFHLTGDSDGDSHVRYLSGLLLGIGLAFASTIPRIERSGLFSVLASIVVLGGVARLVALNANPGRMTIFALAMELGVTPLLWMWQRNVGRAAKRRFSSH